LKNTEEEINQALLDAAIKVRDESRKNHLSRSCVALFGELVELLKQESRESLQRIMAECTTLQAESDDEYAVISNAAMAVTHPK